VAGGGGGKVVSGDWGVSLQRKIPEKKSLAGIGFNIAKQGHLVNRNGLLKETVKNLRHRWSGTIV